MKITDLTLTLFAWDSIPATTYGRHTGRFEASSQLGLSTLTTDEGIEAKKVQVLGLGKIACKRRKQWLRSM